MGVGECSWDDEFVSDILMQNGYDVNVLLTEEVLALVRLTSAPLWPNITIGNLCFF